MSMLRCKFCIFLVLCLWLLAGCGPTLNITPELQAAKPRTFAFLPPDVPEAVRAERVNYLRAAVETELKNEGYSLLDAGIVDRKCAKESCAIDSVRADGFGVDSIVQLKIDSLSRNNFGLGFYNTISGEVTLYGRDRKKLASVQHQESERGGLLFESGQIIQGIKESVENLGDESYNKLAEKFARAIVSALPRPASSGENTESILINSVSARATSPGVFEVCATGSSGANASLVLNRAKTNLRETSTGRYCGIYRIDASINPEHAAVELRSPFGTPVRKAITFDVPRPCDLSSDVKLVRENKMNRLELSCVQFRGKDSTAGSCAAMERACSADKVLVFKSSSEYGPYEKVAELTARSWIDRDSSSTTDTFYQVVPVEKGGIPRKPITLSSSKL